LAAAGGLTVSRRRGDDSPAPFLSMRRLRLDRLALCAAAFLFGSCKCWLASPSPVSTSTGPVDLVVTFSGTIPSDRPLLLYSGKRDGACRSFETHVGTASPTITLTQVSWDPACPAEITVFTKGYASTIKNVTPGSADESWWLGKLGAGSVDLPMQPLITVPVTIWLVAPTLTGQDSARDMYNEQASHTTVFETLGAGITFNFTVKPLAGAFPAECNAANVATISSNPAIYDAGSLNVYYMEVYGGSVTAYGQHCWEVDHNEIIMIAYANENVADVTLAHEFGHSLGMIHPKGVGNAIGGHTEDPSSGFAQGNLMFEWPEPDKIDHIGIGQLYAMNYSKDSWLNGLFSGMARPVIRDCQDSWSVGVCPKLSLEHTGWP
jgi:hypothetical protein